MLLPHQINVHMYMYYINTLIRNKQKLIADHYRNLLAAARFEVTLFVHVPYAYAMPRDTPNNNTAAYMRNSPVCFYPPTLCIQRNDIVWLGCLYI